jgi:hypothetical protein
VSATETFFLPNEVGRKASCVSAEIYNLAHTLLARSEFNCVFVPIRRLQFLGVITDNEIVFVDSQAYAYNQDEGGRIIKIAWKFTNARDRKSLSEPVDCDVVYYDPDSRDIQLRLVGDFKEALELMNQRYRDEHLPAKGAKILNLNR